MTDQTFAVVADGIVTRLCELPQGLDPTAVFGAGSYIDAPASVQAGWLYDGKDFSAPPAPAPPPPETALAFMAFLALFTAAEQAAIITSDNVQIKLFCLMAAGAAFVDLADPTTVGGVKQLEALGLIAKGRAKQVLAGQALPAS